MNNAPITTGGGAHMGNEKADRLSLLYGSVFGSNLSGYTPMTTLDATQKQGFQIAIWNIVYDSLTDWSVASGSGDFYISSSDGASVAAIAQANLYLNTVKYDVDHGVGTRMSLIALTDSAAQPGIQDQLLPQGILEAVPEPSTYAIIAGSLALCGAFFRRRFQAA